MAFFSNNKFDETVVKRTDALMMALARAFSNDDLSALQRAEAIRIHRSQKEVADSVVKLIRQDYPHGADLRRARGLALQRWTIYHPTNNLP